MLLEQLSATPQGVHYQEAITGSESRTKTPGTPIWDADVLTAA